VIESPEGVPASYASDDRYHGVGCARRVGEVAALVVGTVFLPGQAIAIGLAPEEAAPPPPPSTLPLSFLPPIKVPLPIPPGIDAKSLGQEATDLVKQLLPPAVSSVLDFRQAGAVSLDVGKLLGGPSGTSGVPGAS
jgi:hypothetical protein